MRAVGVGNQGRDQFLGGPGRADAGGKGRSCGGELCSLGGSGLTDEQK